MFTNRSGRTGHRGLLMPKEKNEQVDEGLQ